MVTDFILSIPVTTCRYIVRLKDGFLMGKFPRETSTTTAPPLRGANKCHACSG